MTVPIARLFAASGSAEARACVPAVPAAARAHDRVSPASYMWAALCSPWISWRWARNYDHGESGGSVLAPDHGLGEVDVEHEGRVHAVHDTLRASALLRGPDGRGWRGRQRARTHNGALAAPRTHLAGRHLVRHPVFDHVQHHREAGGRGGGWGWVTALPCARRRRAPPSPSLRQHVQRHINAEGVVEDGIHAPNDGAAGEGLGAAGQGQPGFVASGVRVGV